MLLVQLTLWYKLMNACLQASGGKERLNQFPTRVVCPHCLEAMTLKEAMYQGHFIFVSCNGLHSIVLRSNQSAQTASWPKEGSQSSNQQAEGRASMALHSLHL